jgi:flagellar biosynthesis protein FlhF
VDLPGVNASDADAIKSLAKQIAAFPNPQVFLTLNAAYDTTTLLHQLRAFSILPITALIFTHLDEEPRWGKILNFCFGTKCPIAFLSAGQNVPGDLISATPEKIVSRVIPSK